MSEQHVEHEAASERTPTIEELMTDDHSNQGPLLFTIPPPSGRGPHLEAVKAVRRSLRAHTTAVGWLPEGMWPALDAARAELLRVRTQVVAALDERQRLVARFAAEDKQRVGELRRAQREGSTAPVEDRRTPFDQRQAQLAEVAERYWAAVIVMAEKADAAIELVREHEDEWLADLRRRVVPAEEKRREAERLHAEAKAEEFQVYMYGRWVQLTADDGPLGRQPAPTVQPVPDQFNTRLLEDALQRPWHQVQPWSDTSAPPPTDLDTEGTAPDDNQDDVESVSEDDETGVVSELEPEAAS